MLATGIHAFATSMQLVQQPTLACWSIRCHGSETWQSGSGCSHHLEPTWQDERHDSPTGWRFWTGSWEHSPECFWLWCSGNHRSRKSFFCWRRSGLAETAVQRHRLTQFPDHAWLLPSIPGCSIPALAGGGCYQRPSGGGRNVPCHGLWHSRSFQECQDGFPLCFFGPPSWYGCHTHDCHCSWIRYSIPSASDWRHDHRRGGDLVSSFW